MRAQRSRRRAQDELTVLALLTPAEVGRILGVSIGTVKRLTLAGELPHVRVSRRRPRYQPDDVRAFVEEHRVASPVVKVDASAISQLDAINVAASDEGDREGKEEPNAGGLSGRGAGSVRDSRVDAR